MDQIVLIGMQGFPRSHFWSLRYFLNPMWMVGRAGKKFLDMVGLDYKLKRR